MNAEFESYIIRAEYKGDKAAGWGDPKDPRAQENWNNHLVTVTNRHTKKRITFDFWASIMNPEIRKPVECLEAFECFLSDAISGALPFEDFCLELGYDTDSRSAEKIWKACKRSAAKAQKILDGETDYAVINRLREKLESLSR